MGRQTWMGVGVAVVGMALVLGAEQGVAQDASPLPGSAQSAPSGTTSTASAAEIEARYRLEVAQLRTQVAQLQQQLARMRDSQAPVASSGSSNPSTASSRGVDGSGDPNAGASEGATGIGYASGVGGGGSAGMAPASDDSGFALANILHTGRVKSLTPRELILTGEPGGSSTLLLARNVEVLQNGRPIALGSLQEGTLVRTSANLAAPGNPVTRIEVLPSR